MFVFITVSLEMKSHSKKNSIKIVLDTGETSKTYISSLNYEQAFKGKFWNHQKKNYYIFSLNW